MITVVLRVFSEAQMRRVIESSQRFPITVYLADVIPEKLLPPNMQYLGYVFIKGDKQDMANFAAYAKDVDMAASQWKIPVIE